MTVSLTIHDRAHRSRRQYIAASQGQHHADRGDFCLRLLADLEEYALFCGEQVVPLGSVVIPEVVGATDFAAELTDLV